MPVIEVKNSEAVSAKNLAEIVRTFREMRQWSQNRLSALSRLSLRTIQRVGNAQPSSADTHVLVGLFAQFHAPEYHVVLGEADPAFAASDQWPDAWR